LKDAIGPKKLIKRIDRELCKYKGKQRPKVITIGGREFKLDVFKWI